MREKGVTIQKQEEEEYYNLTVVVAVVVVAARCCTPLRSRSSSLCTGDTHRYIGSSTCTRTCGGTCLRTSLLPVAKAQCRSANEYIRLQPGALE